MAQTKFWHRITHKQKNKIGKPPILQIMVLDFTVLLLVFTILQWAYPQIAKSVLLGGLVFFIPNTVFGWVSNRHIGANKIRKVVKGFFRAEMLKYSLTVILFYYVFSQQAVSDQSVFIFSAYMAFWGIHQWGVFSLLGRYHSHTPCYDR